jgi:hypothetical protein
MVRQPLARPESAVGRWWSAARTHRARIAHRAEPTLRWDSQYSLSGAKIFDLFVFG